MKVCMYIRMECPSVKLIEKKIQIIQRDESVVI